MLPLQITQALFALTRLAARTGGRDLVGCADRRSAVSQSATSLRRWTVVSQPHGP
jgi:hypothetical protein